MTKEEYKREYAKKYREEHKEYYEKYRAEHSAKKYYIKRKKDANEDSFIRLQMILKFIQKNNI